MGTELLRHHPANHKELMKAALLLCAAILSFCCILAALYTHDIAYADSKQNYVNAETYESRDNAGYQLSSKYIVSKMSFGQKTAGTFSLSGTTRHDSNKKGYIACASSSGITIGYKYDGVLHNKKKEAWHIVSDSGKSINGQKLKSKVQEGTIIIQKSTDASHWEDVKIAYNAFVDKKLDRSKLYKTPIEDLKTGMFYRVICAYKIERKTGTGTGFLWIPYDENTSKYCLEVYSFYAYYGENPIICRDLISGRSCSANATVDYGFVIDKNGTSNKVTVSKGKGSEHTANNYETITEPGAYTIRVEDQIGKAYTNQITVTTGLKTEELEPVVYQNEKKNKYTEENRVTRPDFGQSSHTVLTIGQSANTGIKHKAANKYGLNGDKVFIFLRIRDPQEFERRGWEIAADSWGKKSAEKISNVSTGQIDKGAIVIQKSRNNSTWEDIGRAKYANGLYTTDFETHYGNRGNVAVYIPDGKDIINGVYIRVI